HPLRTLTSNIEPILTVHARWNSRCTSLSKARGTRCRLRRPRHLRGVVQCLVTERGHASTIGALQGGYKLMSPNLEHDLAVRGAVSAQPSRALLASASPYCVRRANRVSGVMRSRFKFRPWVVLLALAAVGCSNSQAP